MSTLTSVSQADLRLFHEMQPEQQRAAWSEMAPYLEREAQVFSGSTYYPHLEAVDTGIFYGRLVPVEPAAGLFGIVSAIRGRYTLPTNDSEGSVPYLAPKAREVLHDLASDVQRAKRGDEALTELFERHNVTGFRLSVTSLTRTSIYQQYIAQQGRMAVGFDGKAGRSVHESGWAFDIDHGAFYAREASGKEVPLNRNSDPARFGKLAELLPSVREVLRQVMQTYESEGVLMAYEEVPEGWGAWHTSVIPNE